MYIAGGIGSVDLSHKKETYGVGVLSVHQQILPPSGKITAHVVTWLLIRSSRPLIARCSAAKCIKPPKSSDSCLVQFCDSTSWSPQHSFAG